jgi:THAP domain
MSKASSATYQTVGALAKNAHRGASDHIGGQEGVGEVSKRGNYCLSYYLFIYFGINSSLFYSLIVGMGKTCSIVGCKSGYRSCNKKGIHFFTARNRQTFLSWRRIIPRNDLTRQLSHHVCQKHVIEEDIINRKMSVILFSYVIQFLILFQKLMSEISVMKEKVKVAGGKALDDTLSHLTHKVRRNETLTTIYN